MKYNNKVIVIGVTNNQSSNSLQFKALIKFCSKNGWKVIFISDYHKNKSAEKDNIIYLSWPSKRPTKIKDFIFYLKLLKKHHPSVTLSNFSSVNIMVLAGKIFGVSKIICWYRTVIEISRLSLRERFKIFRKSLIYKLADKIIIVSEYLRKEMNDIFKVSDNKIIVIGNSVAPLIPNQINSIFSRKKYIACVGGLYPWKGQKLLIDAFNELAGDFRDINLLLIGKGPDEDKLKKQIEKFNLKDRVLLLGQKKPLEVRQILAEATVSVVPSLSDSFNFVVIESLQVGTPVLAAKVGGIQFSIVENETGIFFEPNNSESLEIKLRLLLENIELRKKLQEGTIKNFNERFSWNAWIKAVYEVIITT